ncbi:hypothetical protein [Amycolatopsis marina]|uniref:hypothetical protein n=1 Tax=Amycolatopsis marina TaxID=490629 RepID=UPI000B80D37E|nr:hypothetical protein [Amycolatopsis marina]
MFDDEMPARAWPDQDRPETPCVPQGRIGPAITGAEIDRPDRARAQENGPGLVRPRLKRLVLRQGPATARQTGLLGPRLGVEGSRARM